MNHTNGRSQFQPRFGPSAFRRISLPEDDANSPSSHPQISAPVTSVPTEAQSKPAGSYVPLHSKLHYNQGAPWLISPSGKHKRIRIPGIAERIPTQHLVVWTIISILVALAVIISVVWLNTKVAADVTLYQVNKHQQIQYIGGGGIIFPLQRFDLSYPVAERVVSVLVKAGDTVVPNQPLIQLDPAQLNIQVKQAADNMAAAQAHLDAVSNSGSAIDVAHAQQQFNFAKNKYNALVAQTSSPLLHSGNLISPMRGVVTTVNINPGEVFDADTVLLTIMDTSVAVVRASIPLLHLGQVSTGLQAEITPSALPNLQFQGQVSSVIPHADPQTDTFEVWVSVDNAKKMLLPGMSAFVRISAPQQGLVVPRLAVLGSRFNSIVFVVQNQHAYIQRVQIAGRVDDTILVKNGLAAGDEVVLVGQDGLRDGQKVRVRAVHR